MAENRLVADVAFQFTLNDRELTLRYRALPLSVWEELYSSLGLEPASLIQRIEQGSPVIIAALIWLERKQRERRLTWSQFKREIEEQDLDFEFMDILIDGVSQTTGETDPPTQATP